MGYTLKEVQYFHVSVTDQAGEAYRTLSILSDLNINLLALQSVPVGPDKNQLTLFPEDVDKFTTEMKRSGLELDGPHNALLAIGNDEPGALIDIHMPLYLANVNIFAAVGVGTGDGTFGYIIYIRPDEYKRAISALNLT